VQAIHRETGRYLGVPGEVRVGLHIGEVVFEKDNVSGMAVHIGARVAALPGEWEIFGVVA
jgi:class 3 adenylate cyclase